MLCVLTRSGPDMKMARVAEHIDREVDTAQSTRHLGADLPSVVLKLFARNGLVSYRLFAGPEAAPWLDVATYQGDIAVVTSLL